MKTKVTIAIYSGLVALIVLSLVVMGPFLLDLALGAAFAVALLPFKSKICGFIRLGNKSCSVFVCALFSLFVLMPMVFATWSLVKRVQDYNGAGFESTMTSFENKTSVAVSETVRLVKKDFELEAAKDIVRRARTQVNEWVQNNASAFLTGLPDLIVHFIMLVLAMFLVLTGYNKSISRMRASKFVSTQTVIQIDEIITSACRDVFFSNILTGMFQSLLVAIGIATFTDFDPYLTFVFTFIVSFIPVVGAAPVAAAFAIYELVEKNYQAGIALAVLSVIVGLSDNILRAILMARDEEDSSVVNLLASIGGIYVWGLPGLFIGPLIVTMAIKMTPLLLKELRREPPKQLILVETPDVS